MREIWNCQKHNGIQHWRHNKPDLVIETGYKVAARTIHIEGQTLNLYEGCNKCRAGILKTIIWNLHRKVVAQLVYAPLPPFVEHVRIGSHLDFHETSPKHGYHTMVNDYSTVFHDCLPGKAWLRTHYQDKLPDQDITITVDGQPFNRNGDFKRGDIKEFMGSFCKPGRATHNRNTGISPRGGKEHRNGY